MRVLLDTHTFLWWNAADDRLSDAARSIITDGRTDVVVSIASIWEVATKVAKGRLVIPDETGRYITSRLERNHWSSLPIGLEHAVRAASLPRIHLDPFDRILVAQAQLEGLPIVTMDAAVTRYDVDTIW
ncbi:MAG: type II toxin-antitoxin system VapC family toxin [Candidatus Limnocylindria bacterium]